MAVSNPAELLRRAGLREDDPFLMQTMGTDPWKVLPFINRGWKYKLEIVGRLANTFIGGEAKDSIFMKAGSQNYIFKYEDREAPGWLLEMGAIYSSPYGMLDLRFDEWSFALSPYMVKEFLYNTTGVNNWIMRLLMWRPVSPYGPLYGVVLDPAQPLPLSRGVVVEASLPNTSQDADCELLTLWMGRVVVDDADAFYTDLHRLTSETLLGQEVKKWSGGKAV